MPEHEAPESLVGNVYEGAVEGRLVDPFVIVKDPPGEHVWIENVDAPHRLRRVQRKRLLSYQYRFVGRLAERGAPITTPPPQFDGPQFAMWLKKWLAAEGLQAKELAARAGLSTSMVHDLLLGQPRRALNGRPVPKRMHPGIETIAAIAHGFDYEFAYVASKAGFASDGTGRWRNFSLAERIALSILLEAVDEDHLDQALDAIVEPQKVGVS